MPYQGHFSLIGQDVTPDILESSVPVGQRVQYCTNVLHGSIWRRTLFVSMDTENTELMKGWEFPDQLLKKRLMLHGAAVSGVFDECRKACRIQVHKYYDQPDFNSRSSLL